MDCWLFSSPVCVHPMLGCAHNPGAHNPGAPMLLTSAGLTPSSKFNKDKPTKVCTYFKSVCQHNDLKNEFLTIFWVKFITIVRKEDGMKENWQKCVRKYGIFGSRIKPCSFAKIKREQAQFLISCFRFFFLLSFFRAYYSFVLFGLAFVFK